MARILLALIGLGAVAHAATVEVRLTDPLGDPLPVRVHVRDSEDNPWPAGVDSTLLSHGAMGGYFYTDGPFLMNIPSGPTRIVAGHGFEWDPLDTTVPIEGDTVLTFALSPRFDLRQEGWFGCDIHTHANHAPFDYPPLTPEQVYHVARCEDLALIWCLDNDYEFIGAPDPVSDPMTLVYFTTEYRHMAMGHVALLGLKELIGDMAGWDSCSVYPLLSMTHAEWSPGPDEAMILVHPQTGAGFFQDSGWPGNGLGRELPVMVALGHLEALALADYSNDPDVFLEDWYGLLGCGFCVPPAAGTDAVLPGYYARPPGGYRVYALEGEGVAHNARDWVKALRAGRSFVTNCPLIPHFSVEGADLGDTLHLPGTRAIVNVSFSIRSVLPLQQATIISNGEPAASLPLGGGAFGCVIDTTLRVPVPQSTWLALRVDGQTSCPHVVASELFAHTAPVYVHVDSIPPSRPEEIQHFLTWIGWLELYADMRGFWESDEIRAEVMQMFDDAREVFNCCFRIPPDPFELQTPPDGSVVSAFAPISFDWSRAIDPEEYDIVTYVLEIAGDSAFADPMLTLPTPISQYLLDEPPGESERTYWWRVRAEDQGHNVTWGTPGSFSFFLSEDMAEVDSHTPPIRAFRAWPNPSSGRVWFQLAAPLARSARVEILDVLGRCIAASDRSASLIRSPDGERLFWDGRDHAGAPVTSGCYWVRPGRARPRPFLIVR